MAEQKKDLPAIRACLFDMDGLLIDSEDIYTEVTNAILREHGKPDLPWKIKAQLQGRPHPEANRIFHEWAQLPITGEEFSSRQRQLQAELFPCTKPLPGVPDLLHNLAKHTNPQIHIALATSSHAANYAIKTGHLSHIFSVFVDERKVLGDDPRIPTGRGKPAPDIYLLALKTINEGIRREGKEAEIKPEECLVFEDSVPGIESGRRAGMQVVWVPHPGLLIEYKGREEEVLAGLTGEHKEEGEVDVGKMSNESEAARKAGAIGDGWGVLLENLVDFPYERFGIKVSSHDH